jgi:hypothetical protein
LEEVVEGGKGFGWKSDHAEAQRTQRWWIGGGWENCFFGQDEQDGQDFF